MGMSETMSSPGDWVQFYNPSTLAGQVAPSGHSTSATMFGDRVSEATVVTTTVTSVSTPSHHLNSSPSSAASHLNPEGRVSKPIRRRSRASRRTPTTLLNTDTTNFRAMVQQFTGGPSGPFSSGSHPGALNFNFALGSRQHNVNPAALMFPAGYQLQFQRQQQPQQQQQPPPPHQQQYQHQHQHQQQQYVFSLNNSHGDAFLQRLSNPRPHVAVSDGFVMEGVSSHVPGRSPSSNDGRSNGYMF